MAKCSFRTSQQTRTRNAFTLAELLIVIAIIAVLIGILLPALSAARRSSAAVKCLSSLRQFGSAFQQYAQENKRYFPVVRWKPSDQPTRPSSLGGGGINPADDPSFADEERIWVDYLAKYLIKKETYANPDRYLEYQNNSVLWGCPSFETGNFDKLAATDATGQSKRYSMSYGMSRYAIGPYRVGAGSTDTSLPPQVGSPVSINGTSFPMANLAEITTVPGQFFKMEQWGRRGQDKALVMDSNGFSIQTSTVWTKAHETANPPTAKTQPAVMGMDYPASAPSGSYISIDATRHIAPTANVSKVLKSRGTNMLFVDGHAQPVSPREAWIAVWGAGMDLTQ
jgi:prepilin-type N-terminal cleavage/methylation domain-containing protein/prepilin-type processing-associated H-X9-DG protein